MTKLFAPTLIGAVALATFSTTPAHAGLESCGNIDVEANAECKVVGPEISCEAACEPLEFKAACAARLEVECTDIECEPPELDVECSGECSADCSATCEGSASFDCDAECEGSCDANCEGDCSAKCDAEADGGSASGKCQAECEASCQANCDAKCEASCEAEASGSCEGQCEASCEGQCQAEADFECQVDCQSKSYAECETELRGGCEAQCEVDEGVASCDGEYIDHGGKLEDCLDSIQATIEANIDGYAEWESRGSCDGNSCEGEVKGEAGVSCAAAPHSSTNPFAFALAALALVGVRLRRRRG